MKWGKMKFPALEFDQKSKTRDITKYGGRGIPRLVLLDRDGTVISDSYQGERYVGPTVVLNKLKELAE